MAISEEERAFVFRAHESLSATAVAIDFMGNMPQEWRQSPLAYGSVRINIIGKCLVANFPTWQEAAEYDCHVRANLDENDWLISATPVALAVRTFDEFLTQMRGVQQRKILRARILSRRYRRSA